MVMDFPSASKSSRDTCVEVLSFTPTESVASLYSLSRCV